MTEQRGSFRKTVMAVAVVVLGSVAFMALLEVLAAARGQGVTLVSKIVVWGLVVATLLVMLWASLVATGGLIALHRDALEERGQPYGSFAKREALVGPFRA